MAECVVVETGSKDPEIIGPSPSKFHGYSGTIKLMQRGEVLLKKEFKNARHRKLQFDRLSHYAIINKIVKPSIVISINQIIIT